MPQRFELRAPTVAVTDRRGKPEALTIPAGAEVIVISVQQSDPADPKRVMVEWNGQRMWIFLSDLNDRGVQIGFEAA